MYQSDIDQLTKLISIVEPNIGLSINILIDIIKFFQTSDKKSLASEVLEKRVFSLLHAAAEIKNPQNIYKRELEIRIHEDLLVLQTIKDE